VKYRALERNFVKVVFVRHGESTGNAGVPSFDLSQLELTDIGREQAERTAVNWQQAPTMIAMSPYLRTHLTAAPTIRRFPDVPVEILPMEEFTYLEPSRWNGTSRQARLPHIESFWKLADPAFCDGPGAESFQTLLDRVARTLARFEALPSDALIYAFSHGQFMQAVRQSLLHPTLTPQQKMAIFWTFNTEHPILNADLLEVCFEAGQWSTHLSKGTRGLPIVRSTNAYVEKE
jgi:broad specificity phosphatase PhoE